MITKKNRTQEEINEDETALMFIIEQLRMDYHDRCDENTCEKCCPRRK